MCRTLGVLPSPLWGGVGGGGREMEAPALPNCATPLPSPPPQGGREQTEFAACADPTSPECALAAAWQPRTHTQSKLRAAQAPGIKSGIICRFYIEIRIF